MFDQDMKNQLSEYFKKLTKPVEIRTFTGLHSNKDELMEMLNELAGLSNQITITETTDNSVSPISFDIYDSGKPTGIRFSGVPGGHEFSSLVLSILQTGGVAIQLDNNLQQLVKQFSTDMKFQTVVSLSCHNCPEVVQTLNSLSLLNQKISHEMIDGGLFPEFVEKYGVQSVPTVLLNGEPFSTGKMDAGQILNRLIEQNQNSVTAEIIDTNYDIAIIGGGPAGVAAAVYGARKGLSIAMIADRIGGQVKDTMSIENLITLAETTGPKLSASFADLVKSYSIDLHEHVKVDTVIDEEGSEFKTLVLNTGTQIRSRTVIIATGAKWRELNVPGEKEFLGKGVAYCPHCDGPFFKDKDVAVIGGGNSGIEAALDLAGIVRSVKVFEFADKLNADKILLNRLNQTKNIESFVSAQVSSVLDDSSKVIGLRYKDRNSGQDKEVDLDGIFIQIGLIPHTSFVKDIVETNRQGEIIIDDHCRTSRPGIFAAGDATTTPYKQIAIAIGEGAKASLAAFEYLLTLPQPTFDSENEHQKQPAAVS
ncbi:MAG: alkyl hydroperoxide reductase subunit F [Leptonema sp. (in: Bacteria)]|nr:alkyl hydroperoxide reductase subunit F [Leptonema sp. (in: bacteria)]